MATYYVRPDGNNANTGTADTAGGAWATVKYACSNALNAVLANGDLVYAVADQGTYTENAITIDRTITLQGLRGIAVIDGTGGAAGSDIITTSVAATCVGIKAQNAVDRGFTDGGNGTGWRVCLAVSCGGIGFEGQHVRAVVLCSARSCGGNGFDVPNSAFITRYLDCESGDNTGHGFVLGNGASIASGCLAYDCTSDGFNVVATTADGCIVGCTSEGNGVDGWDIAGALPNGWVFLNNVATNNVSVGFKAGTSGGFADYNNLSGNGTARTNFPTGTNDTAAAPGYVLAGSDDYTLDTGSAMIGAGYSPFKSPMLLNQGATIAEVASASGGGGTSFIGLRSGL